MEAVSNHSSSWHNYLIIYLSPQTLFFVIAFYHYIPLQCNKNNIFFLDLEIGIGLKIATIAAVGIFLKL